MKVIRQTRNGKPGRPKSEPGMLKEMIVSIRMSRTEHETIIKKAKRMNMTPCQWLRTAALNRQLPPQPVPEANLAAYRELTRLAVNINQLTRAANEGRAVVSASLLLGVHKEIIQLQRALLGEAL